MKTAGNDLPAVFQVKYGYINKEIKMSYREFVNELKLDNKVIAVKRVNSKDEKTDDIFGCVYKALRKIMHGERLVLKKGSCSCGGFDHNSGLDDSMPSIPGGFGVFLSHGSDQMWTPPGERFKSCPKIAEEMFDMLPKNVMDDFDAIRFEPYREGIDADIVVIFVNPDQLSAVLVLHGYSRPEYDTAIAGTVSGCASMLRIPFAEMKKERPKAVITGTDIAQRNFVDEDKLAISIAGWEFEKMLEVTEDCYFHSPVFKKIRERIHEEEDKEKRYSILA